MSLRSMLSGIVLFSLLFISTGIASASTCPDWIGGDPSPGPAISITTQSCTKSTVFVGESVDSYLTVIASDTDWCGDPYPVEDTLTYTWSQTSWTTPGTYTVTCTIADDEGPGQDGCATATFTINVIAVGSDDGGGDSDPPPVDPTCSE